MNWQPIETAPRDGTDVLVLHSRHNVPVVHIAWYRDGSEELMGGEPFDIGWWSYIRGSVTQELLDEYRAPTHWMPLPEIPV